MHNNGGKTIINHPFGNGNHTTYKNWWFGGCFIVVLTIQQPPCNTKYLASLADVQHRAKATEDLRSDVRHSYVTNLTDTNPILYIYITYMYYMFYFIILLMVQTKKCLQGLINVLFVHITQQKREYNIYMYMYIYIY